MTLIYFVITLSVLIVAHEWGHFIVARLFGIRVEKFSIGFGPKIWGVKRGDTEYKLSAIPFGGYVKMSGDELSELDKSDPHAFYNKAIYKRALVVLAGPVMNIVLCFVLMPLVFMVGQDEPAYLHSRPEVIAVRSASPAAKANLSIGDVIEEINGEKVANWGDVIDDISGKNGETVKLVIERNGSKVGKEMSVETLRGGIGYIGVEPDLFIGNEAVLDDVIPGEPADIGGLKNGDKVISIGGKTIGDWTDMIVSFDQSRGNEVLMIVDRDGKNVEAKVTPKNQNDIYVIGISKDIVKRGVPMVRVRFGFFESIAKGFEKGVALTGFTLEILYKLFTLQLSFGSLAGPVGIAGALVKAADTGFASLLLFVSFLSLQLGFLNLLPIPVLDGGHVVFFGIEAIRRKPINERLQGMIQQVFFAILILLFVAVSFNDLKRIKIIQEFINKIF